MDHTQHKTRLQTYQPLFVILAIILVLTAILSQTTRGQNGRMPTLMGVRFIVFGVIKLPHREAFAHMFAKYDIIARRSIRYGYLFPLCEIALGIGYFIAPHSIVLLIATIILSGVTTIGISLTLMSKRKPLSCACMGSWFEVPLGRPSLLEQVLMLIMAGVMLIR